MHSYRVPPSASPAPLGDAFLPESKQFKGAAPQPPGAAHRCLDQAAEKTEPHLRRGLTPALRFHAPRRLNVIDTIRNWFTVKSGEPVIVASSIARAGFVAIVAGRLPCLNDNGLSVLLVFVRTRT